LDHDGYSPIFARRQVHEVKVAQVMTFPPGSITSSFGDESKAAFSSSPGRRTMPRYRVLAEKPLPKHRSILSDPDLTAKCSHTVEALYGATELANSI